MTDTTRYLPKATPETEHFWEGTRNHELRLQNCSDCGRIYFPPQPFCPDCHSDAIHLLSASGRASLHSYVISHMEVSGLATPHIIAVVELEEGPRMMTNIVGVEPEPENLAIDMPLRVQFAQQTSEITLPLFEPVSS